MKVCKCGHLHPKTFWKGTKRCENCDCKHHVNFDFPNTIDRITNGFTIGIISFILFIGIFGTIIFYEVTVSDNPKLDESTISPRSFAVFLFALLLLGSIVIFNMLMNIINDYRYMKNRQTFQAS